MRKWLKHADSDDVTMVVSGFVAVAAFCAFVLIWFVEAPAPECGRNCATDFSSVNRSRNVLFLNNSLPETQVTASLRS
jgi:hypothetical protein